MHDKLATIISNGLDSLCYWKQDSCNHLTMCTCTKINFFGKLSYHPVKFLHEILNYLMFQMFINRRDESKLDFINVNSPPATIYEPVKGIWKTEDHSYLSDLINNVRRNRQEPIKISGFENISILTWSEQTRQIIIISKLIILTGISRFWLTDPNISGTTECITVKIGSKLPLTL